jgi:ABC-type uncharacterized transport system permease subunit
MLHYLFYKFYKAAQKTSLYDIAAFAASVWLAGSISINLLSFEVMLSKLNIWKSVLSNQYRFTFFMFIMICSFSLYFFYKKKYREIINHFSNEPESQRKKGNLIVWTYAILTILMIFVTGLFKPGYWPKF